MSTPISKLKQLFTGPKPFDGEPYRPPSKGAYKSPGGALIPFDFEDLASSVGTKSAPFELANGEGTYVQPRQRTGGRHPMRVFFAGANYLDKAKAFMKALVEPGEGVLSHPVWGELTVVPVGEIRSAFPFKSGAGQAIFDVDFYETTGLQIGAASDRRSMFDGLMDASAVDFSEKIDLGDVVDKESFKNKVRALVKTVSNALKKASAAAAIITEAVEDAGDSVDRGLDLLLGQPLALARQTQILLGEPRRQVTGSKAKLAAYNNLAASIFSGTAAELSDYNADRVNSFHLDKLAAAAIVANHAQLSADTTDHVTRADYINAAEAVQALLDDYQAWHDANYAALDGVISDGTVDTGDGLGELHELVNASIAALIAAAYKGKTQFTAPLDNDRVPLELCYELYGTTRDDVYEPFCLVNEIDGDEIFLLPKGREIVWYV